MAIEDWFDPYDDDETYTLTVVCKFCGAKGLIWEVDDTVPEGSRGRYYLFDEEKGRRHVCPPRVLDREIDKFFRGE